MSPWTDVEFPKLLKGANMLHKIKTAVQELYGEKANYTDLRISDVCGRPTVSVVVLADRLGKNPNSVAESIVLHLGEFKASYGGQIIQ